MTSVLLKFLKYTAVGASGMAVDFLVTFFLKEKLKLNKYFANSTGFAVAASSNFLLNRMWTFQSHNAHISNEYFSFLLVALTGLLLNNLLIYFLSDRWKYNFYLAKIIAIGVVTLWNFGMNYLYTFAV